MNSTGYELDRAQIIKEIRGNIRDNYKNGFPVIKEIIQNADDAENATEFHFGFSPGLKGDLHPLAQAPAVFFINNGDFRAEHENAIKKFNYGSKAIDKASVGKFGLGMKSVFHWCEAFFYLYGPKPNTSIAMTHGKILNPWMGTGKHEQWNNCPLDLLESIRASLSPIIGEQQFFCLWIPLRREQDLEGVLPIVPEYPRVNADLVASKQAPWGDCTLQIAGLLPLLHRIRKVVYWVPEKDAGKWKQIYSLQLSEGSQQRRSLKDIVPDNKRHYLSGQVVFQSLEPKGSELSSYVGVEVCIDSPRLQELQESTEWPIDSGIDPDTFEDKQVKEKGEPHASVSFISLPSSSKGKSTLLFQRAVFLPVEDAENVPVKEGLDFDLRVVLHGYFFVDGGRTRIEGLSEGDRDESLDDDALRSKWNNTLMRDGALPLLIPAFRAWIEHAKISDEEVKLITMALRNAELTKKNLMHITQELQWLYRLRPDGSGSWETVPASAPFFEIPAPRVPDSDPIAVFPELANIFTGNVVTYSQTPRITSREALPLELVLLDHLLESVSVETVLAKPENLEYFVSFMRQNLNERVTTESTQLKRVLRKLIHLMPVDGNGKSKNDIRERMERQLRSLFVELSVPWLIPLPEDKIPLCREIAQFIASQESCPVLVPDSFMKNEQDDSIDPSEVLKVLRAIGTPPPSLSERKQFSNSCHKLVLYLLQSSNPSRILKDDSIQQLALFNAIDCTTDSSSLVTFAAISEHCKVGTAFTGQREREMARLLQKATPKLPILLLDEETYKHVSDAKTGRPCNNKNITDVFQRMKPPLGSPENRAALLSELLKNENGAFTPEAKHAYRYLLHASGENYESDETLIVSGSDSPGDIWAKVSRTVLHSIALEWCYVESELAATLNKHQRNELCITSIDRATTVDLLRRHQSDLHRVDFRGYAESEREQILEEFPSTEFEILKSLPVHTNLNGELTHVDERTFLLEEVPTCSFVRSSLNLISHHVNRSIAKRQQEFIKPLTPACVLHLVLRSEAPVEHWKLIAELLKTSTGDEIRPELERLKDCDWIPATNGSSVAPKSLLWIPELVSAPIQRGRVQDLGYSLKDEVPEEFWSHPGVKKLRKSLLPSDEEQLQMLGKVLGTDPSYGIGASIEDEDALLEFVETFRGKALLPIADILGQLVEENREERYTTRILKHLVPALPESIAPKQYIAVLQFLSHEESRAAASVKQCWRAWHDRYLTGLAESGCIHEVLPEIQLKSVAGTWKSANELCIDQYGIRREDVLGEEHAKRLKLTVSKQRSVEGNETAPSYKPVDGEDPLNPENVARHIARSARRLEDYFKSWMGKVSHETLGGFIAFLGGQRDVEDLAQRFLEPRSVARTREALRLTPDSRATDIVGALKRQRFVVTPCDDATVSVCSITGRIFNAMRSIEVETVFLGDSFKRSLRDGQTGLVTRQFWLRTFDVASMSDMQLQEILRRSLEDLIRGAYSLQIDNLDQFWDDLSKTEQLDVAIARQLLLDPLFTLVQQMGISKAGNDQVRQLEIDYRRLGTEIAEAEATGADVPKGLRKRKRETQEKLSQLIESDMCVQDLLLSAVRRKIQEHYQYQPTSIPYELFQNADDASVELMEMRGNDSDIHAGGDFIIVATERTLRVMHWGRTVNKFREGAVDFRDRGYDCDLIKMLTLNISDKGWSSQSACVTGKFGLGFKSVHLVTDRPKLKSGRVCAEIVAGTWPRPLSSGAYEALDAALKEFNADDPNGTVVELPDLKISASDILADFRLRASMLLAFSRSISTIRIVAEEHEVFSWQPVYLDSVKTLATDRLMLSRDSTPSAVLKVNAGPGALLFRFESTGFAKMPRDIPTVWVTAPTSETSTLGFAINGPFPLDVGRAQLSRDETSYQSLAREIGHGFLSAMEGIYEMAKSDWGGLVEKLKMHADLEPYSFWVSVWELLVEPFADSRPQHENNAVRLMREVLWGEAEDCLRKFYQDNSVIPTDLWDSHCTLTRAADVETVLEGILGRPDVFRSVSSWGAAMELLSPGRAILSRVHELLLQLGILERRAKTLSLVHLLEKDTERGGVVTAEKASLYGELINPRKLQQLAKDKSLEEKERESLLELLSTYKFIASDGSPQSSKDLVILSNTENDVGGETESDEGLRAAFAPDSRVLASTYSGVALEFFRICRRELRAPVAHLVDWALMAHDESRQNAVLEYLLNGRLAREMGEMLCGKKGNLWLENFRELPYYGGLDDYQKGMIEALLGVARSQAEEAVQPYLPIPISAPDPAEALQRIHDWWTGVRESETQKYERKVYPSGAIDFLRSNFQSCDIEQRKSWYSLFLLGMTHTMGRTSPEQHRGFLSLCGDKNWLDVFATREVEARDWIGVLDEFVDNPSDSDEYSHWMKLYPDLYRISKYADEYIDAFLGLGQFERDFNLGDVTSTRTSSRLQGGGIGAPKITRALGIGVCFVMRELVRKGILHQPLAYRHCYVPTLRVRRFLSNLGCEFHDREGPQASTSIHEFIVQHLGEERATFELSFDLPFMALIDSAALQRAVIGRELVSDLETAGASQSEWDDGDFVTLWNGRVIPRDYMN